MPNESITRRDILRTLAFGAVAGSMLQVIPAEAAEYVHQMVHKEKAAVPAGSYTPKYFSAVQYATLLFLCDAIIPKDEKSGGAVEAGAPEFIDLLTSENPEYQLKLGDRKSTRLNSSHLGISYAVFCLKKKKKKK